MERFDKRELAVLESGAFERFVDVKFQDIDAAGIVFFSRFFDYVHETYERWLTSIDCPLPRVLRERSWAAPLRHVEADYLAPVRFGDRLRVLLARAAVEAQEVSLGWVVRRVSNEASDRDSSARGVAVVQTVHAFVDPTTFRRVDVPSAIQTALSHVVRNK